MDWIVLLPIKTASVAKSRLAVAWPDPAALESLVLAMRRDTLDAVRGTRAVVGVVAAVDRPAAARGLGVGVDVVVQRSPGLNDALADADAYALQTWPDCGRIAVVGDLPALTTGALGHVLDLAAGFPRSFVPDLAGTGTTMLAVTEGPLEPQFGPGSALRHSRAAHALPASAEARHDVDVPDDLVPPATVGFGPATAAVLAHHRETVGCPGA